MQISWCAFSAFVIYCKCLLVIICFTVFIWFYLFSLFQGAVRMVCFALSSWWLKVDHVPGPPCPPPGCDECLGAGHSFPRPVGDTGRAQPGAPHPTLCHRPGAKCLCLGLWLCMAKLRKKPWDLEENWEPGFWGCRWKSQLNLEIGANLYEGEPSMIFLLSC